MGCNRRRITLIPRQDLAGDTRKPPDVGAGFAPGLPPPGRGEAEPLLKEEREGGMPLHYIKSFIINALWKFRDV